MEKKVFCNSTIEIESNVEMNENTAQLGWLTRGAASDFHFAQKSAEWLCQRRSHTVHRKEGLNISRHENGRYRVTITLPSCISANELKDVFRAKAINALQYFEK